MVIPKFSNEAEEATWWDAHRSEIEAEIRQQMKPKRPKEDQFEESAEPIAAEHQPTRCEDDSRGASQGRF